MNFSFKSALWSFLVDKLSKNKFLFAFSVTHQNALCVSLRPNKHAECNILPHETFADFWNILKPALFASMFMFSSFLPLLAHYCFSWPVTATCRSLE